MRAVCQLANGKRVFVVCGHFAQRDYMRNILRGMGLQGDRVRFVTLHEVRLLRGLRENAAVFVDHHAREVATVEQWYEFCATVRSGVVYE
jgi:hypothetical protein